MFSQLLGPFGFFTLALSGILWLAQILPLVEIVIDNGRAGTIFLEFSALILPNILVITVPISAFVSTIYSLNRMFGDSEIVVAMAAGLSPFSVAKPTIIFGFLAMIFTYILVIFLQPPATTLLGERIKSIKQNAVSVLLVEKQFLHPSNGLSIYINESSNLGEISGLFLHDQRDLDFPATYSANEALLLQDENELRLVMSEGTLQRFNREANTLNILDFQQFVFDLTDLFQSSKNRNRSPLEYKVGELLDAQAIIDAGGNRSFGAYIAEAHNKLATPLLALILPLIGAALLLSAQYRRSGYGYRIAVAVGVGVLTVAITLIAKSWVTENPDMFFAPYLPGLLAALLSAAILFRANGHRKQAMLVGRAET